MTIQEAIDYYGSPSALAQALGIQPEAISNWKRRTGTVPKTAQFQLQVLTRGRLKVDEQYKKRSA